ncbi:hypothetical protein KY284_001179 [Solanum tuberosum]|nr:hypothetical protein KY284_001179 [Solanum tuberosum]
MSIKKLYPLAMGPDVRGRRYPGCIVNGVRYHIQSGDELRQSQNSGIVVEGYHENEVIDFYGYNTKDSDLEDDTMIEYMSDLDGNEGTKSTDKDEDGDIDDDDDIDFVM